MRTGTREQHLLEERRPERDVDAHGAQLPEPLEQCPDPCEGRLDQVDDKVDGERREIRAIPRHGLGRERQEPARAASELHEPLRLRRPEEMIRPPFSTPCSRPTDFAIPGAADVELCKRRLVVAKAERADGVLADPITEGHA